MPPVPRSASGRESASTTAVRTVSQGRKYVTPEIAQMLVESGSRAALQHFLAHWHGVLHATREKGLIRWAIDVDPLTI